MSGWRGSLGAPGRAQSADPAVALPRLLAITPASSLSFVLDTTGSMGEEIHAAKSQARHIAEQRRGGPAEPAHYVLVPFHDPGAGRRDSGGKGSCTLSRLPGNNRPASLLPKAAGTAASAPTLRRQPASLGPAIVRGRGRAGLAGAGLCRVSETDSYYT